MTPPKMKLTKKNTAKKWIIATMLIPMVKSARNQLFLLHKAGQQTKPTFLITVYAITIQCLCKHYSKLPHSMMHTWLRSKALWLNIFAEKIYKSIALRLVDQSMVHSLNHHLS